MINIILLILSLSLIPKIDIWFTKYIYQINFLKILSGSQFIKRYFLGINCIFYAYFIYLGFWKMILYHSLFDLLFINFFLKWCIKRIRPISSLFKDDKYFGLTDFKFTSKWAINQSFTSSHVSFTYSVFYLFWNFTCLNLLSYSYLIALIIMILCRINKGAHYLSDCCYSLIFCTLFYQYII